MSKKELQKAIRSGVGLVFSADTLNINHLLAEAHDLLKGYSLRPNTYGYIQTKSIAQEIKEVFAFKEGYQYAGSLVEAIYYSYAEIPRESEHDAHMLWNDICGYLDDISPAGYYFGSQEGDGACIGWWKLDEREEA